jgi:hypothetical protein
MTHDTRYFTKPLWYYDPAAKQEMSIVFNPDTGELVHTDGVLPIESLLSIVRTDNSVMLLYMDMLVRLFWLRQANLL